MVHKRADARALALEVERVSCPVMTSSVARGLLEAVLWKPAIAWHIERISVLKQIKFTAFWRNEVNNKASLPKTTTITNGGPAPQYFDDRTQRNTVALSDADYVVETHFTMTEKAGSEDNMTKFVDMFDRRVERGQHFHQPYFGCREFVAEVLPAANLPAPVMESRDLGVMLWDIRFAGHGNIPIFFAAHLTNGVLEIPANQKAALLSANPGKGGKT